MTIDNELLQTDTMVKRVMAAHAPPLMMAVPEPFLDYIDTNVLFNLTMIEWAKFFGAVLMISFAAGLAYGGVSISHEYLFTCP